MSKCVRYLLVLWVLGAFACGQTPGPATPAPTLSVPPILTATPTGTGDASGIVGRWVILLSGLELEFLEDGQFFRWAETGEGYILYDSGKYRFSDTGRLVIDLGLQQIEEYEYRLDEKWLTLRDAAGKVSRYWRKP